MRRHYTEAIVISGSAPEELVARVKACDTALDRREHRLVRPSSVMSRERIIEESWGCTGLCPEEEICHLKKRVVKDYQRTPAIGLMRLFPSVSFKPSLKLPAP